MTDRKARSEIRPEPASQPKAQAPIAVSPEQQIALAEYKRQLAITKYKLSVQRGLAWANPKTASN